jgi:hypothetical protein
MSADTNEHDIIREGLERAAAYTFETAAKLCEEIGRQRRGEGVEAQRFAQDLAERIRSLSKRSISETAR